MASIQFDGGKCHGAAEAKAMMRHACADERVRHEHSNEDIDKSKTRFNTDLHGLTYEQMCSQYDRAIEGYQQRASKTIRKDAVTMYDAIITVPKDLPADRENDWYRDVEKAINDHYGKTVVMDIKIHRDEIHEYTDPGTKQKVMSRTHGHCFMIPDVNGRLNAKQFSNRANMRSLNREIDIMTREKYHVQFLTGEKTVDRGFQTVEQLKRSSDAAELQRQTQQAKENRDAARREQGHAERARDKAQSAVDELLAERTILSRSEVSEAEKRARTPLINRNDEVIIPRQDYESLLQTAKAGEEAIRQAKQAAKERRDAEKAIHDRMSEAEQKAANLETDASRKASEILKRAQEEAAQAHREAAEAREEAEAYKPLQQQYKELKRDFDRMQTLMQGEYIKSVFKPLNVTQSYEAARRGELVAQLRDGTFQRVPTYYSGGLVDILPPETVKYGVITDEPRTEVPDRVLREIRQLTNGQEISHDLRAVLDHAEGISIAKSHSRGISR